MTYACNKETITSNAICGMHYLHPQVPLERNMRVQGEKSMEPVCFSVLLVLLLHVRAYIRHSPWWNNTCCAYKLSVYYIHPLHSFYTSSSLICPKCNPEDKTEVLIYLLSREQFKKYHSITVTAFINSFSSHLTFLQIVTSICFS